MQTNLGLIVSTLTLAIGIYHGESLLWIPGSTFVAASIDALTRPWYSSDKVGSSANLSAMLKFVFALIGVYSAIGLIMCLGVTGWWLFG